MLQVCFTFLFVLWVVFSYAQPPNFNGISLVASPSLLEQDDISPLLELGTTDVAVMPFGFVRSLEHPEIIYNTSRQWFGETYEGAAQYIDLLKNNNLRVMLKPQIWIWRGEFTGQLQMRTEEAWQEFEQCYSAFILEYARLAAEKEVELFCIGTELENFIMHRPQFWNELIRMVKSIYKGKLTYAANWDEYKRVPFWGQLDFIGLDAYFPISESKTVTVANARMGWQSWKNEMKSISSRLEKPVLFTEYGYRSMDHAGKEPWTASGGDIPTNLEAQANLLTALYEELWGQPWFAGGFLWKWFVAHDRSGGPDNNRFTPQNKPAGMVVQYYYTRPH